MNPFDQLLRVAASPKRLKHLSMRPGRPPVPKAAKPLAPKARAERKPAAPRPRHPMAPPRDLPRIGPINKQDHGSWLLAVVHLLELHGPLWTSQLRAATGLGSDHLGRAVKPLMDQGRIVREGANGLPQLWTLIAGPMPADREAHFRSHEHLSPPDVATEIQVKDFRRNQKALLRLLLTHGPLWSAQLAKATGLTPRQIQSSLKGERRAGRVTTNGSATASPVRYEINPERLAELAHLAPPPAMIELDRFPIRRDALLHLLRTYGPLWATQLSEATGLTPRQIHLALLIELRGKRVTKTDAGLDRQLYQLTPGAGA